MSDTSAFGFGKFVPGFDFLQNLSQTASKTAPAAGAIPGMPSWVAPTLNVEEIDKRIQALKAVQFWLEQNGTALKATIQALEVQKMTLTTLQGMNVNMADLAKAFTAKPPQATAPAAKPEPEPEKVPEPEVAAEPETTSQAKPQAQDAADKPAVDPMAWWGSLTQQFQNIAGAAMKDVAAEAMKAQAAAKAAASSAAKVAKSAAPKAAGPAAQKAASKKTLAKKAVRKVPARKRPAA